MTNAWAPLRIAENVLVGPIVAALAFVCSIGNVPLAAVLWAGGGSFAGVLAFLYGDLIVLPLAGVLPQGVRRAKPRRCSSASCTARWCSPRSRSTGCSRSFGLVPLHRPSIASVAERPVTWNYTSFLDVVGAAAFVVLVGVTVRRGVRDPVCGMTVDRNAGGPVSVHDGRTVFFCSAACKDTYDANPEAYS